MKMSGESSNRPDFCVFSNPNEQPWRDYFQEMLENKELKLSVKCEDVTLEKPALAEFADCVAVIILLSPSMLTTMTDTASNMVTILQNHPCVAVIRMMTPSEEFDQRIKARYTFTRSWHEFEVSVADEDDNRRMIASIIDLFEKERTPKKPRPSRRKNIHKEGGTAAKSVVEMVCPDCVRKADERVVVVFREAVTGTVQIGLKDSTVRIDTKKLNPCCYRFNAPDHKAGKTKLIVYIDGKKSGHSWPFRYEAPTLAAYQTPAFLCHVLGLDPADPKGLDEHLTAIYKESLPGDECLAHMLTSQVVHNRVAGVADCQLPTLLHFAAYYGLQDLCVSILETPGAEGAFEVTNRNNQNPCDLAVEQGHEDIADYMDSFMEMQCCVQDYEAMYKYINTPEGAEPVAGRGYMSMSGRAYVPHVDYTAGGIPAHEEDGYVLFNQQQALVSEVRPEDDVRPEIPAREAPPQIAPRARQPTRPTPPSSLPPPEQVASAPNTTPLRSGDRHETPDDIFSKPPPLSPQSMGSRTGDELCQMQEAFRQGEFTIDEVQRLFRSWQSRNPDSSSSMKERQTKLQEIKAKHGTLIRSAEQHGTAEQKKKSIGFLSRLTRKKTNEPTPRGIEIEHCVGNQYTAAPTVRPDRLSTISNTSTISSSSSSSRDSALGPIEEYTDSEPEEFAPPVPRRESSKRGSQENRQSLSDLFLASVPHRPASRLPQPPPTRVAADKQTLAPKLPPRKFSR